MNPSDNLYADARPDVNYVVLGAGGFLGAAMVERFHRSGAQVVPLIRRIGTGAHCWHGLVCRRVSRT